jgi:hypothetical protein
MFRTTFDKSWEVCSKPRYQNLKLKTLFYNIASKALLSIRLNFVDLDLFMLTWIYLCRLPSLLQIISHRVQLTSNFF